MTYKEERNARCLEALEIIQGAADANEARMWLQLHGYILSGLSVFDERGLWVMYLAPDGVKVESPTSYNMFTVEYGKVEHYIREYGHAYRTTSST